MSESEIDLSHLTLKKIAQSVKLRIEIDTIKKEKEILVVRSEIENLTPNEQILELDKRIEKLNTELKSMGSIEHPLLNFKTDIEVFKERIKKLEEKRGTIDFEIYTQLKQEYKSELDKLTAKMKGVFSQLTKMRANSTENISKSKIKKEELLIRTELEGLDEKVVQEQLTEISQTLENNEELMLAIDFLIEKNRE